MGKNTWQQQLLANSTSYELDTQERVHGWSIFIYFFRSPTAWSFTCRSGQHRTRSQSFRFPEEKNINFETNSDQPKICVGAFFSCCLCQASKFVVVFWTEERFKMFCCCLIRIFAKSNPPILSFSLNGLKVEPCYESPRGYRLIFCRSTFKKY